MSRRRRGERLPRTRLPGIRSADSHTRQTDQAIPARATSRHRRLRPAKRRQGDRLTEGHRGPRINMQMKTTITMDGHWTDS